MKAHSPKASVVIPLYNKAPFISEAINSILNQTFSDFELIVVDDYSTDGSQEIVNSIKDPRIHFYQNKENLGTAKIANKLIELSRGEYIVRMDADDIAPDYRLQKQLNFMDANPAIGVSSGKMQAFGTENNIWEIPVNSEELKSRILFNCPIHQPAAIIRKSVLIETGIRYNDQSPNIGEDWLFWFYLSKHTQFSNQPEILNFYRIGEQNITVKEKENFYNARFYLYEKMFIELGLPIDKIEIHFYTKPYFRNAANGEKINEFFQWLNFLKSWNEKKRIFPHAYFLNEINKSWERLFYFLAMSDKSLIKTYRKCKPLTFSQKYYRFKILIDKCFK